VAYLQHETISPFPPGDKLVAAVNTDSTSVPTQRWEKRQKVLRQRFGCSTKCALDSVRPQCVPLRSRSSFDPAPTVQGFVANGSCWQQAATLRGDLQDVLSGGECHTDTSRTPKAGWVFMRGQLSGKHWLCVGFQRAFTRGYRNGCRAPGRNVGSLPRNDC
jgi:hypothetical protein